MVATLAGMLLAGGDGERFCCGCVVTAAPLLLSLATVTAVAWTMKRSV